MLNMGGDVVPERTLLVLVEAAQRLGIDVDVRTLSPTRYRGEHETVVPVDEYQAVLRRVFADDRETLGIGLAETMPLEAMGLWGFLLRTSPTFGEMLRRAERYARVFFRFSLVRLIDRGSRITLVCDHPDPSPFGRREQEICFFLGQWVTLGRALIGDDVIANEVRMRWQGPADPMVFDAFFGCPVDFDRDDDALVFDRGVTELPLPGYTPELTELFEGYATAMIQRIGPEGTVAERVRSALSDGLLTGAGDESAVAQKLGFTKRTLHRQLAESGLSFRQIRRDLLRARAEKMLRDDRLPIAEIAYLLGYAEASTFHRAFRSWTGLTPGEWRKQHSRAR